MLVQNILPILITLQEVLSYHFYNPDTHQVLSMQSLGNVPSGYKIIPPPKYRKRRLQNGQTNNGVCTEAGFTCVTPFDKSLTYQYECDADSQCPRQYKCCPQKCFVHKICRKVEVQTGSLSAGPSANGRCGRKRCQTYDRPGTCEIWPYNCQKPYDYSLTSVFKCERDRQCPRSFKCCQQRCFSHKICSRTVATNVRPETATTPMKTMKPIVGGVPAEILSPTEEREPQGSFTTEKTTSEEITTEETTTEETTTEETTTEETTTEETTTEETTTEETTAEETTTEETTTEETSVEVTTTEATTAVETTTEEAITPAMITVMEDVDKEETEKEDGEDDGELEKKDEEFITSKILTPVPDLIKQKSTPDPNAIIPEYSDYYYHYGTGNDSATEDDYDEEDDEYVE